MYNTNELQHLKTGLYSAIDADGKNVIIQRQEGNGWSVITPTHHNWCECVDYDENGDQECVRYLNVERA